MLEKIDEWNGIIKGKTYRFFVETLTDDKVNINCCLDFGETLDCLAYEVPAGVTRAEVEAHFEKDPAFLATWGRE